MTSAPTGLFRAEIGLIKKITNEIVYRWNRNASLVGHIRTTQGFPERLASWANRIIVDGFAVMATEGVSELESLRFQNEQLRKDLVEVTGALTELREQNETYRNNFEQVKNALLRVQSENEELRRLNTEVSSAMRAHAVMHT
jgi:hypothetical protein